MNRRNLVVATASASVLAACGVLKPNELVGTTSVLANTPQLGAQQPSTPKANTPLKRIAFGSCIDQNKPQPMWAPVLSDNPDLFIFGGDNVYASAQPWQQANLDAAYVKLASHDGFTQLRATVPHIAIWDDHDYGLNDGGANFLHKQASKDTFLNFWGASSTDSRRSRDGLYESYNYGPAGQRVQVILLDARWNKSPWKPTDQRDTPGKERYVPDTDPNKTMLGAAQWTWLETQLKQPADVRLIVSGVQVLAEGHGWERWGLMPLEQQKLFDLINQTRANGIVFLAGDRHIGALYKESKNTPYSFYELTSSGMTHPWADAKEAGPNRLGELVTELHYGMVEIDWATQVVSLQLRNKTQSVVRRVDVPLSQLQLR